MSTPTMSTETRDARLTCAKCSGKGSIAAFSHYANGVCFWCKGEGKILVRGHNALQAAKGQLLSTADIVLDAAKAGNVTRRDFYLALMVEGMFAVGTEAAREILTAMRSGVYHDEHEGTGYRTARCPLPAAKAAADRLVELGRAAKAAA